VADNDTIGKTVIVALTLCVVCSVVVSTAAVMLKPAQQRNLEQDKRRNILAAAGMYREDVAVDRQFARISARLVDLRTGRYSDDFEVEGYDALKAAKDPARSTALGAGDSAGLGRREHYAVVYVVGDSGSPDAVILPVRGAGLWGQLHGFLALGSDADTVVGLGFYEHKETPGLGGEVDNPRWKALWPGKRAYRDDRRVALTVIKGTADREGPDFVHEVDGLSGATLTVRGVNNLVRFWIGENGFGPFLANVRTGEA